MHQLVASVPISGSFVDFSTLHEYFTIRVGVFCNLNPHIIYRLRDIRNKRHLDSYSIHMTFY